MTASATFPVFGTTGVLIVTEPAALATAAAVARAELAAIDLACSRFRPDSELSRLNRTHGELAHVSQLFAALIGEALRAAELTDGDVDPTCGQALASAGYDRDFGDLLGTAPAPAPAPARPEEADPAPTVPTATGIRQARAPVPAPARPVPGWRTVGLDLERLTVRLEPGTQLDLGSTAKAWAADHCAGLLAGALSCGVLVSLGGDVAVAGQPPGDGWQVRVTDDHAAPHDAPGQTVTIRSGGLATSSTTVRAWRAGGHAMHHIIDPHTAKPARSCWRTVSVAAKTCADANIASTAAIVRSERALAWLTEAGLPARLVRHDGSVETTPAWPSAQGPAAGH